MSALREKFEDTFQFLACYFTEDFSDDFGDPDLAVKKFILDSNAALRACVVKQLRQVLTEHDEDDLEDVIFELGCYYSPQRDRGISMKTWLEQVIAQLEQSLDTTRAPGSK